MTCCRIVPSPDGSRIYIGGSFTNVNGQIRNRIAALNPTTGALITTFQPKPDATVRAIAATNDTVYFGGLLSSVNGIARTRVRGRQGHRRHPAPLGARSPAAAACTR